MTAPTFHPTDALQELLDGRLDTERRATVESHLAECARCRRDIELLHAVRDGVKAAHAEASGRADGAAFGARVRAVLDREDSTRMAPPSSDRTARRSVLSLVAAAAAILIAVLFAVRWMKPPVSTPAVDLVADALSAIAAVHQGTLVLDRVTERPDELETFFAQHAIGFRVRVFDLAMMGWRVIGGRVHRIGNHDSALYVYRDGREHLLVCQMFLGRLDELPPGSERFVRGTIPFAVHERNGITAVFWAEANVLCLLVSDLPRDAVIALATAKAMAAGG